LANRKKLMMIKKAIMVQRVRAAAPKNQRRKIKQVLPNFTVIATDLNNIPRQTTGWTATLSRPGTADITANFDEFGVAVFTTIATLTTVSYTLRVRNADNTLLATRSVPADREVFVVRF